MKQKLLVAAILGILFPLSVYAADEPVVNSTVEPIVVSSENRLFNPIALPGYTWGNITYPNSVIRGTPDNRDVVFQGKIEQGADWVKFGSRKEFTFNTYVNLNYTLDTDGVPWNNKVSPGVGAKIRMNGDWGVADLGVQYVYQNQWKNPDGFKTGDGVQVFLNWYSGWDLKR